MGFKFNKSKKTGLIPKGTHNASIVGFDYKEDVKTKYGYQHRLLIKFKTEDGYSAWQGYNAVIHENSHLGKLIIELLDELPEEFDTDMLLGIECDIEVEHYVDDKGIIHPNIVSVNKVNEEEKESA
jgi:hypothetical protein